MTSLPWDPVNHGFLYWAGTDSNIGIYSNAMWFYDPNANTFTKKFDNGATATANCPQSGAPYDTFNPTVGHPNGSPWVDGTYAYMTGMLCQGQFPGYTFRYNLTTQSTTTALSVAPFGTGDGTYNATFVNYQSFAHASNVNKGYYCCYSGGGSTPKFIEFNGTTWTDKTASLTGDTLPLLTGHQMVYLNGYLWVYGGCIGTSPGNTGDCATPSTDIYRINPTSYAVTKMTPTGTAPDSDWSSFPLMCGDTSRNRFYILDTSNTLRQYDISGNAWSTVSLTGDTPFGLNGGSNGSGNMAGYDPDHDLCVFLKSNGQSAVPAVTEIDFGGSATLSLYAKEMLIPNQVNKNATSQTVVKTFTGITRSTEPLTVGIPLPDVANYISTSNANIVNISSGQFECLGQWPSGRCKWMQVDTFVPSLTAGTTTTISLNTAGTGSYGGSNLATDGNDCSGAAAGYICINTGSAQFTIRKSSFNILHKVVDGATTYTNAASTANDGFVITGPAFNGTTCSEPPTDCTTLYKSINDSASTAIIETTGPVRTVIKASGSLKDSSGNTYLKYVARLTFWKGKSYVKIQTSLRNADESSGAGNFASAYKGYRAFEARLSLPFGGSKSAMFSTHNSTRQYNFSSTESAYLYQAYSTRMQRDTWNSASVVSFASRTATGGSPPYTYAQDGYQIVENGVRVASGTNSQYQNGWGDLKNTDGTGVLTGIYQMSAYWPKSIQFESGGSEVRIGLWPDQTKMVIVSSTPIPYYIAWPQQKLDEFWFDFHTSTMTAPQDEWLKHQHYLVARATSTDYYNSTGVFPTKLVSDTEQDTFYAGLAVATPTISAANVCCAIDFEPAVIHQYSWSGPGGDNSSDFRWDYLLQFFERGWTGRLGWAREFMKFIQEDSLPLSDGFSWITHTPANDVNVAGNPSGVTSANSTKAINSWTDGLHDHIYGSTDWYFFTGDRFVKDWLDDAMLDHLNPNVCFNKDNNSNCLEAQRGLGIRMLTGVRALDYANQTGNTVLASTATQIIDNMYSIASSRVEVSTTDVGMGNPSDYGGGLYSYGTNSKRGIFLGDSRGTYFKTDTTFDYTGCANGGTNVAFSQRLAQTYQVAMMAWGLIEAAALRGTAWANYYNARDYAYGMTQWATTEGAVNDNDWQLGGFRYSIPPDLACTTAAQLCECEAFYPSGYSWGNWSYFGILPRYSGDTTTYRWLFDRAFQRTAGRGSGASIAFSELGNYGMADAIYWFNRAPTQTLKTLPINTFTDNGGGSYTVGWNTPTGTDRLQVKYSTTSVMTDWIGFDVATHEFTGNSALSPWFSSINATSVPAASTGQQSMTISTGQTGLSSTNFMVKAVTSGTPDAAGSSTSSSMQLRGNSSLRGNIKFR